MANPRQRRKARSGTNKVKQSRRQQDKLKKIIVRGPPSLVAQWDVKRTALQNYAALGLQNKRPMALRQSGGIEKDLVPRDQLDEELDALSSDSDSDEESEDAAEQDSRDAQPEPSTSKTTIDGAEDSNGKQRKRMRLNAAASKSSPPTLLSKDIPKGFARIERDAQGNVLRVIMSAHDEPEEEDNNAGGAGVDDDDDEAMSDGEADEQDQDGQETPWGKPVNDSMYERSLKKASKPIPAKNPAIAALEARTAQENTQKAASTRFSSPQEAAVLRELVKKYGDDVAAMSRDMKLNRDQRTAGQLKKALARAGGIESLRAAA